MALTHWQTGDRSILVSHKSSALTVSMTETYLASYDHGGRMLGVYDAGVNYRRGLNNRFQKRWREADRLFHRALSPEESRALVTRCQEFTVGLPDDAEARAAHPETAALLQRIGQTSFADLEQSAGVFTELYGSVPILPPDQYRSVLLQATDGCTWNECTFCTLYRDRPFRSRGPEEFRNHIQAVLKFLGPGLSYRNSIFLGDANAIALSMEKLDDYFTAMHEVAALRPILSRGGVHAFLDIYTGRRKSSREFEQLKKHNLRRVSLGIESGSEALLEFVNKPGSRADMVQVVTDLKAAGLAVIVILMVGLGGMKYRRKHLAETGTLIERLPLSKGDIIYLSQFAPKPVAPYLAVAETAGVAPLTEDELHAETSRFKEKIGGIVAGRGVQVVPYSFGRFIY